jgi:hypothetical protein
MIDWPTIIAIGITAAALLVEPGPGAAQTASAIPNYKELIYRAVQTTFVNPSTVGAMEISPLHPTRLPQLGEWMACIRFSVEGQPTPALYAAFFDGDPPAVTLFRRAVQFDRCSGDEYVPFRRHSPRDIRSLVAIILSIAQ